MGAISSGLAGNFGRGYSCPNGSAWQARPHGLSGRACPHGLSGQACSNGRAGRFKTSPCYVALRMAVGFSRPNGVSRAGASSLCLAALHLAWLWAFPVRMASAGRALQVFAMLRCTAHGCGFFLYEWRGRAGASIPIP